MARGRNTIHTNLVEPPHIAAGLDEKKYIQTLKTLYSRVLWSPRRIYFTKICVFAAPLEEKNSYAYLNS